MEYFEHVVGKLEDTQKTLTEMLITDDMPFSQKKIITSAMRRLAPMGLATNIGWTCNLRSLRWILQLRTDPSAEEEIRIVFDQVAEVALRKFPNLFADFKSELADGHMRWYTDNEKV